MQKILSKSITKIKHKYHDRNDIPYLDRRLPISDPDRFEETIDEYLIENNFEFTKDHAIL